jgi:hypothetical protein
MAQEGAQTRAGRDQRLILGISGKSEEKYNAHGLSGRKQHFNVSFQFVRRCKVILKAVLTTEDIIESKVKGKTCNSKEHFRVTT